jgi:hypothetical protein
MKTWIVLVVGLIAVVALSVLLRRRIGQSGAVLRSNDPELIGVFPLRDVTLVSIIAFFSVGYVLEAYCHFKTAASLMLSVILTGLVIEAYGFVRIYKAKHRRHYWRGALSSATGFGAFPMSAIALACVIVVVFGILYGIIGLSVVGSDGAEVIHPQNLTEFVGVYLYFSASTFISAGGGDIRPAGLSKVFVIVEGVSGYFILALFVALVVKKEFERMSRAR